MGSISIHPGLKGLHGIDIDPKDSNLSEGCLELIWD